MRPLKILKFVFVLLPGRGKATWLSGCKSVPPWVTLHHRSPKYRIVDSGAIFSEFWAIDFWPLTLILSDPIFLFSQQSVVSDGWVTREAVSQKLNVLTARWRGSLALPRADVQGPWFWPIATDANGSYIEIAPMCASSLNIKWRRFLMKSWSVED